MPSKRRKPKKNAPSLALPFDRILIYALAFIIFALPLFVWPGASEYGYAKTIVGLIAVSVLAILWGLSAWQKGEWKIRLPWISFPLLGFVVASLISLVAATNGRVVVQSLVLVIFFALFMLILLNVVRDRKDVCLLLFALLASGFLVALYGLLQYLGIVQGISAQTGPHQAISTLGNSNYLGGFLTYLLFPSTVLLFRLKSDWLRVVSILLIAFCFGMVLAVEQMGVVVALVFAAAALIVGWLIFRPVEPIRRNRIWLLALLLALVLTFLIEAPSGPLNSLVGLSQEAEPQSWLAGFWARNSGAARTWDWWVGWEMFKAHPLTGVGLGNYKLNFVPYKATFLATSRGEAYNFYLARAAQAHNDYVQMLAEVGILGALSVVGLIVVLVASVWLRMWRNPDEGDRLDLLLLACGIVAFLIHALVSFPLHLPASSLVLIVVVGLMLSRAYGTTAEVTVRLRGWWMKGVVVGLALVGVVVSVFAARDLHANVLMNKGILQVQLGNNRGAMSLLEESIGYDFAPRQTYYYLAVTQTQSGEYEEAQANLEMCFTRFVDEAVYLTYANLTANLGKYSLARAALDTLLASHPQHDTEFQARYVSAMVVSQQVDALAGTALLLELIEEDPGFTSAYVGVGYLYQARGLIDFARDYYTQALELIARQLDGVNAQLSAGRQITVNNFRRLLDTKSRLQRERDQTLERLDALPPD
ncbi:Wzy polymerase domain-containing protein [Candidatus Bipolaricaulota bacterium]